MDQGGTGRDARQRYTVTEAAQALGLSVDAIRSKVKRNSIPHTRDGGRVYILLSTDHGTTGHDQSADQGAGGPQPESGTLTSELRDRLRYVEEQLDQERQAHAEARRLLMAALERIPPALEAPTASPPGAREADEAGEAPPDRGTGPRPAQTTTSSPRPWWRRILGG